MKLNEKIILKNINFCNRKTYLIIYENKNVIVKNFSTSKILFMFSRGAPKMPLKEQINRTSLDNRVSEKLPSLVEKKLKNDEQFKKFSVLHNNLNQCLIYATINYVTREILDDENEEDLNFEKKERKKMEKASDSTNDLSSCIQK